MPRGISKRQLEHSLDLAIYLAELTSLLLNLFLTTAHWQMHHFLVGVFSRQISLCRNFRSKVGVTVDVISVVGVILVESKNNSERSEAIIGFNQPWWWWWMVDQGSKLAPAQRRYDNIMCVDYGISINSSKKYCGCGLHDNGHAHHQYLCCTLIDIPQSTHVTYLLWIGPEEVRQAWCSSGN